MGHQSAPVAEITAADSCMRCGKQHINESANCTKDQIFQVTFQHLWTRSSFVRCELSRWQWRRAVGRDASPAALRRSQTPKLIRRPQQWEGQGSEEALVIPHCRLSQRLHIPGRWRGTGRPLCHTSKQLEWLIGYPSYRHLWYAQYTSPAIV